MWIHLGSGLKKRKLYAFFFLLGFFKMSLHMKTSLRSLFPIHFSQEIFWTPRPSHPHFLRLAAFGSLPPAGCSCLFFLSEFLWVDLPRLLLGLASSFCISMLPSPLPALQNTPQKQSLYSLRLFPGPLWCALVLDPPFL